MKYLFKALKKTLPLALALPVTLNWLIYMRKKIALQKHKKSVEASLAQIQKNQDLGSLTYYFSQDLNIPLRKIKNYSDSLLEDGKNFSTEIQDKIKKMASLVEKLEERIGSFVEFIKIEKASVNLEEVNLNNLVSNVLKKQKELIKESNTVVDVLKLPIIHADVEQMDLLFSHILLNSLKYKKESVQNHILIHSEQEKGLVKIMIQDNGIGMNEQKKKLLFSPFHRASKECEEQWSGFGLFLCKKIMEKHQGQIDVVSSEKLGTIIILTLPTHQKSK